MFLIPLAGLTPGGIGPIPPGGFSVTARCIIAGSGAPPAGVLPGAIVFYLTRFGVRGAPIVACLARFPEEAPGAAAALGTKSFYPMA